MKKPHQLSEGEYYVTHTWQVHSSVIISINIYPFMIMLIVSATVIN